MKPLSVLLAAAGAVVLLFPRHSSAFFLCPPLPTLPRRSSSLRLVMSSSSPQHQHQSSPQSDPPLQMSKKPANMTTPAGATAAAFDLLVGTIQQLSVVIEEKQELSKEEVLDRLDDWMAKLDRDSRGIHTRMDKINKDVNRAVILLVVGMGVALATTVPAWFSAAAK